MRAANRNLKGPRPAVERAERGGSPSHSRGAAWPPTTGEEQNLCADAPSATGARRSRHNGSAAVTEGTATRDGSHAPLAEGVRRDRFGCQRAAEAHVRLATAVVFTGRGDLAAHGTHLLFAAADFD
ncbi:unnamed protein product [Prorocentrum cordatum]|uniref:Uncharacterized protein n=1 Tax=Prorocentrum cordatum TaxID=2364126 RepID=A0ABN9XF05_9DINO|nr:unnamed protein product [Polarella glacialis]